ncbi:MAG: hypothetical protein ABH836_03685 [Candidatus Omnitrophota bacterium]
MKLAKVILALIVLVCLLNVKFLWAYFGWENGTTQGWMGNTYNSTEYYYSGQHSLALNLNFSGNGFESLKTSLPNTVMQSETTIANLSFKVYIPASPQPPLDLKAQIYIEDAQGKIRRGKWCFLLSDDWNDLSENIPAEFQQPLSLSIIFGTNFKYKTTVYIDQSQTSIPNEITGKPVYSDAFYSTYIPPPEEELNFQLIPNVSLESSVVPKSGGFGTINPSATDDKKVALEPHTLYLFFIAFACFIFELKFNVFQKKH